MDKDEIMNMSLNDCIETIQKKDIEIIKLKETIERLKKKCKRYEKKLSSVYLNGEFE